MATSSLAGGAGGAHRFLTFSGAAPLPGAVRVAAARLGAMSAHGSGARADRTRRTTGAGGGIERLRRPESHDTRLRAAIWVHTRRLEARDPAIAFKTGRWLGDIVAPWPTSHTSMDTTRRRTSGCSRRRVPS